MAQVIESAQIIISGMSAEQFQEIIRNAVRTEYKSILEQIPPTIEPPIDLITRKETKGILGISYPTLNEWTKNGIIPAQRIGTRIRYKREDVYNSLKDVETIKYKRS